MSECPVCSAPAPVTTVSRNALPSMQNYVYRTEAAARAAARARFVLATCRRCSFSWNAAFDSSLLAYDAGYDNAVPSTVMERHYDDIAMMIGRTYALDRGYVVDVGCGNGTFLKRLCAIWPECRALGVDPALPRDAVLADGRLTLVKGVFTPDLLDQTPSLIVLRHVLEHMPSPVSFVRELRTALSGHAGVPLYVEVPDLAWILDHQAFWDFCYEHCNYFTHASLAAVLARSGFTPADSGVAFGGQYRWMTGTASAPSDEGLSSGEGLTESLREYSASEQDTVRTIRERLRAVLDGGGAAAVWGMATKGIMFTLMVDPDSALIDLTVDVNGNKQGCYVPLSGRRIEAPAALAREAARPLTVVVMNLNYLDEIVEACRGLGVNASFLDATGSHPVRA